MLDQKEFHFNLTHLDRETEGFKLRFNQGKDVHEEEKVLPAGSAGEIVDHESSLTERYSFVDIS